MMDRCQRQKTAVVVQENRRPSLIQFAEAAVDAMHHRPEAFRQGMKIICLALACEQALVRGGRSS